MQTVDSVHGLQTIIRRNSHFSEIIVKKHTHLEETQVVLLELLKHRLLTNRLLPTAKLIGMKSFGKAICREYMLPSSPTVADWTSLRKLWNE